MLKKYLLGALQYSFLTLCVGIPLSAQDASSDEMNDLKREIEALKEGQQAIQEELREIKGLLRPRRAQAAAPAEFVLDVSKNPFRGDRTAPLTLVEFTDYQ